MRVRGGRSFTWLTVSHTKLLKEIRGIFGMMNKKTQKKCGLFASQGSNEVNQDL